MSFLTAFLITVLTSYLALTDSIALKIASWLPEADTTITETLTDAPSEALIKLSSEYSAIPRILIDNSNYQSAAAIEALSSNVIAINPLDALVNIYCVYTYNGATRAVTGTGSMIDSDGIILTNAHVAQFLLLEDILGDTNCIIRTGNPAVPTYEVALLYISPAWIMKHAHLIGEAAPKGTGERDYALLYVTGGLSNKPIPRSFPALALNEGALQAGSRNKTVRAAGYPAETLFRAGDGNAKLIPKIADTSIAELMTFNTNTADVITVAGSGIGEQGSSGGPIMNSEGELIGMISTRGDDAQFGAGSLRALTLSYVGRTYEEETGVSLTRGLSGNLPYRAKLFKDTLMPILEQILKDELDKVE